MSSFIIFPLNFFSLSGTLVDRRFRLDTSTLSKTDKKSVIFSFWRDMLALPIHTHLKTSALCSQSSRLRQYLPTARGCREREREGGRERGREGEKEIDQKPGTVSANSCGESGSPDPLSRKGGCRSDNAIPASREPLRRNWHRLSFFFLQLLGCPVRLSLCSFYVFFVGGGDGVGSEIQKGGWTDGRPLPGQRKRRCVCVCVYV